MAAGWVCSLAAVLSLACGLGHGHRGAVETYDVSAGHFFLLRCGSSGGPNVTWSRGGNRSLSLPSGVEVRQGALWFLPMEASHNGTYTCEKRGQTGSRKFRVSVSRGQCPPPAETRSVILGASNLLPCKQKELFGLDSATHIRWLKDCSLIEPREDAVSISQQGDMRLPSTAEEDAGIYTCLVEITLDGRNYTAARSFQLRIDNDPVLYEPMVVYPKQEKVVVELGARVELKCVAYLGVSQDSETQMFWTVNGSHSDDHTQLTVEYTLDNINMLGLSTLSISEVLPGFLEVPIHCHVKNPIGEDDGEVRLQEADHSTLHTSLALCLASSLALLAVAAGFLFFKMDLVLAYRKLCPCLSKQTPDGKLYDAYVSFLHADGLSSSETATFALQVLPEVLEKQHGYSLYIRGRDDCPGEAMHDVIAAAVCRSRRLIIVLSAQTTSSTDAIMEEVSALHHSQNQLCYEQRFGLYNALTQNGPRVILVETDGAVDYNGLPESLRYIKKRQGALKWRKASPGKHKLRLPSNRLFWKSLRYQMPSVPAGRRLSIV